MDTLLQVTTGWILPAIFFWLILSLIAMTIIEAIQQTYSSRQKGLEKVLRSLVGEQLSQKLLNDRLVNPLKDVKFTSVLQRLFARWFSSQTEEPSYISQFLFAKVVMNWILPQNTVLTQDTVFDKYTINKDIHRNIQSLSASTDQLRHVLHTMVTEAYLKTETLAAFLDAIEQTLQDWFLEAVNEMSPRYAASLQVLTLLVSLAVAIVANFDVIDITKRLWTASKYPEVSAIVQVTEQPYKEEPCQEIITRLPVGWDNTIAACAQTTLPNKVVGIYLGGFFIAFGSKYIYNLTKRQYIPAK